MMLFPLNIVMLSQLVQAVLKGEPYTVMQCLKRKPIDFQLKYQGLTAAEALFSDKFAGGADEKQRIAERLAEAGDQTPRLHTFLVRFVHIASCVTSLFDFFLTAVLCRPLCRWWTPL